MAKKVNINILKAKAIEKQGKLISDTYINSETSMEWECFYGHKWNASWHRINQNHWCPVCNGKQKQSIETLQKFATEKGGKLLSNIYTNAMDNKLLWQCFCGNIWAASWDSIKRFKSWCPKCASTKPSISTLQEFAICKGGKLLSTVYINNSSKLLWQCEKNHLWEACWNKIKDANQWCPKCKSFKTEVECVKIVETLLNVSFHKKRIYYDNLNKHKFIEFDGYNKELKLAIEYQGYQHYEYPNIWHKNKNDFERSQQRDKLKKDYCIFNNIKLLEIPYTEKANLHFFILQKLKEYSLLF